MLRRLLQLLGVVSEGEGPRREPPRVAARKQAANDYPAVAIIPGPRCCEPARRAFGRKVLKRDAPRLPLPGCSTPQACTCRFRNYEDRRQDDRRHPFGGNFGWSTAGGDRRRRRGRRSSDQ